MTRLGLRPRIAQTLAFASLSGFFIGAQVVCAQSFVNGGSVSEAPAAPLIHPTTHMLNADSVIARMIERNRLRNQLLQNYSAVRKYEILDQDGQVSAEAIVRVDYRAPGTKSFQRVSEDGSWMIRHVVFDRLLQAEEETSSDQERREASISEENYGFAIIGEGNLGTHHCYIVEAQPKRPDKYLFEGQLWIDALDFGIARISGRPAARLSFWISNAHFDREYQNIDGFWLPYRDETTVDVKAHGTKVFRIEHRQYVINKLSASAMVSSGHD